MKQSFLPLLDAATYPFRRALLGSFGRDIEHPAHGMRVEVSGGGLVDARQLFLLHTRVRDDMDYEADFQAKREDLERRYAALAWFRSPRSGGAVNG